MLQDFYVCVEVVGVGGEEDNSGPGYLEIPMQAEGEARTFYVAVIHYRKAALVDVVASIRLRKLRCRPTASRVWFHYSLKPAL